MKAFSRILLTGGGTAGHVNPALAIGRALGDERTAYLYVGVRGRAEADIVPREGIPIRSCARPVSRVEAVARVGGSSSISPRARCGRSSSCGRSRRRSSSARAAMRRRRRCWPPRSCGGAACCRPGLRARAERGAGRLNLLVGRLADRVFVSFSERWPSFRGTAPWPATRCAAESRRPTATPHGRRWTLRCRPGAAWCSPSAGRRARARSTVRWWTRWARSFRTGTGSSSSTGRACGGATARTIPARTCRRAWRNGTGADRRAIEGFYVSRPYFHDIEQVYALADLVGRARGRRHAQRSGGAGAAGDCRAEDQSARRTPGDERARARRGRRRGRAVRRDAERGRPGRRGAGWRTAGADHPLARRTTTRRLRRMGAATRAFAPTDALEAIRRAIAATTSPAAS